VRRRHRRREHNDSRVRDRSGEDLHRQVAPEGLAQEPVGQNVVRLVIPVELAGFERAN
jgi:hypothetical protein